MESFALRAQFADVETAQTVSRLVVGTPFALQWASTGIEASAIVQIAIVNVATGTLVPIAVRPNTGSFSFVPSPRMGAGLFFFELSTSLAGKTISAASSNFVLETPPAFLFLRQPDGRTSYTSGQTIPLRWDSGNLESRTISLRLVRSDGYIVDIAEDAANTGIYSYLITSDIKSGEYSAEVRSRQQTSAEGSVACDGSPVSSFAWLELESPDPKRRAKIASPTSLKTNAARMRVGLTRFELVVKDRLNQESRASLLVRVGNRKIVTATICLDESPEVFSARLNETAALPPLASAISKFLKRPTPASAFGQMRAATCPEGGSAAVSVQVPAVVGRTGSEIAEELSRMAPSDFPNGALTVDVATAQRGLLASASFAVTRLFVRTTPSTLNMPPSTPKLAIFPASRYSYIVVDPKTKVGATEIVATSEDAAPGVLAAWEWYVEGQQQEATGESLSLRLKVGTYRVQAVALDDEFQNSDSEILTLHVVDEYTCNVGKDLVIMMDAATSIPSQAIANDFVLKFLRPFWIQGPDSFVSIVRYSLPPAGNASIAVERAEVKTAHDALVGNKIDSKVNPSTPRLLARGIDAAREAASALARKGIVRSVVLMTFDQPMDASEALNASAPVRQRSNLYAVPMYTDSYAFESGLDLFRSIPNTTNLMPVSVELPEELQRAAIDLAKAVCEGKAPPGADAEETDVGKTIGQAITVAVAAAVGASVAGAVGSSVGASMGGGLGASAGTGGGIGGIVSQAQFISATSFLSMQLPGTYNSTASSTQWTMLYLGSPWRSGSGNSSSTGAGARSGRRLLGLSAFVRESGGEIATPYLQESMFWSAVGLVGVTVIQILVGFLTRTVFRIKESPKLFWFPKPQASELEVAVVIVAYEGFVLAAAATARLNDTFWSTVGSILLACIAGTFFVFAVLMVIYRVRRKHILWVELPCPDWRHLWAMTSSADAKEQEAFGDEIYEIKHRQDELHIRQHEAERAADGRVELPHHKAADAHLLAHKHKHQPHHAHSHHPAATLQLSAEKPMDEYSRTKRWVRSRWAATKKGCRQLRENFRNSVHRRRLALIWRWMNWERGVWIVNPERNDGPRTLWSSRNFRWTFDAFFESFRGDNFGQWFGHSALVRSHACISLTGHEIWDIFRKLAAGLVVGLVNDRNPDRAGNPSAFYISLQVL
eukprot:tig00020952_g16475.t1